MHVIHKGTMMKPQKREFNAADFPDTETIRSVLKQENYRRRFLRTLGSTVSILIVVAAAAVLLATLYLPIFRIYGSSMSPTLEEGDYVLAVKTEHLRQGDLIAFYYNNKLLVKRVIATGGEWVDIDREGNVFVNDVPLEEPYLQEKSFDNCDITLPYQVPEGRVFVMGDHRSVSLDSRMEEIGCISGKQIAGKLERVIWPLFRG